MNSRNFLGISSLMLVLASCGNIQVPDGSIGSNPPAQIEQNTETDARLEAQSPVSWIVKRGFNKATKEILKREIKGVVTDTFGNLRDKKFKEFFDEATQIADLFEDPWWAQVIEVVPVAGDIYGGLKTTARLQEAARRSENLYSNAKNFAQRTRYLRQRWSNSDSELIGHYRKHAECFGMNINEYLNLGMDVVNSGVAGVRRADGTVKYTLSNGDFAITRGVGGSILTAGKSYNCPGY